MNKAIMIGRLTKAPDMRNTKSGKAVAIMSIAVNRKRDREQSDFFDVVVFGTLAEICAKHLVKGQQVCVIGEIQKRSYEANDGSKRYVTEIIADEVEFLAKPNGAANNTISDIPNTGAFEGFMDVREEELPF